jgi:hypothetical protein
MCLRVRENMKKPSLFTADEVFANHNGWNCRVVTKVNIIG